MVVEFYYKSTIFVGSENGVTTNHYKKCTFNEINGLQVLFCSFCSDL